MGDIKISSKLYYDETTNRVYPECFITNLTRNIELNEHEIFITGIEKSLKGDSESLSHILTEVFSSLKARILRDSSCADMWDIIKKDDFGWQYMYEHFGEYYPKCGDLIVEPDFKKYVYYDVSTGAELKKADVTAVTGNFRVVGTDIEVKEVDSEVSISMDSNGLFSIHRK